jgi:hypothetical protein
MLTPRTWFALVGAPAIGAVVYACLTRATLPETLSVERPSLLSLFLSGAVVGLIFELAVVIPLYFALRRWQRLNALLFLVVGSGLWFALSFAAMLFIGDSANGASATAVLLLLPGVALVSAFWFLAGQQHVA